MASIELLDERTTRTGGGQSPDSPAAHAAVSPDGHGHTPLGVSGRPAAQCPAASDDDAFKSIAQTQRDKAGPSVAGGVGGRSDPDSSLTGKNFELDSAIPDSVAKLLGRIDEDEPNASWAAVLSDVAFAAMIGVSTRRVRELVRESVISRHAPGQISSSEVQRYCAFLRGHRGRAPDDELRAARLRTHEANAEKLELANARARGEMVSIIDVRAAWSDILRDVRAGLLAVPSRCRAASATLSSSDLAVMDREVRLALERLADDR